jgi:hypothetical protein
MSEETSHSTMVPEWYLKTFHATQHAGGTLRHVENELRVLLETQGLDTRVGNELSDLLTALHSLIGGLVLVDDAAREALHERLRKVA